MEYNFDKFLKAQEYDYTRALSEITSGKKVGHWMWYIFPQIYGLGHSITSKLYAISSLEEAKAYLSHPVLGVRLREIVHALLQLEGNNPTLIFGFPDDAKLHASLTLFSKVDTDDDALFSRALEKFFNNLEHNQTIEILKA